MRILTAVLAVLISCVAVRGGEPKTEERWFVLMMQGTKAGHAMSVQEETAERITSRTEMVINIKRAAMNVKIEASSVFVETPDGKPISMRSVMQLGAEPTVTEYVWKGDQVEVTNGKSKPVLKPSPKGDWLTPAAAARRVEEQLKRGDKSMTISTIDPSMGLEPITATRTFVSKQAVEVMGRDVPGVRWNVKVDKPMPMDMVEYTDEAGEPIKSSISLGFIEIEQMLADKDLALAKADAPELFMNTLVQMAKPIEGPRAARSLKFRVHATKGDLPDLPSTAAQRFERLSASEGRVTVDLDHPVLDTAGTPAGALGTSHMIDPTDNDLQKLVDRAKLAESDSLLEKADKLRAVVSNYISRKDLSVGFASSGETVRTKTGDCTEHAVLLAAVCRRAGVPARVASGLVYVQVMGDQENVFGYHMWTQVLAPVEGGMAWVDVDGTLQARGPRSDATHIALMVSELGDDDMQNFMVTTAPVIGRMAIEEDR